MAQKFGNGRWVWEGFLDNRIEGAVVGRVALAGVGPVEFYLSGDFKGEIAGRLIRFRNSRFEEDDLAAHVLADFESPQIGEVSLISFDPHPNLTPHPYIEWFSTRHNHYRIELAPGDAWIAGPDDLRELETESRAIRERLAGMAGPPGETRRPTESDWV